MEEKRAALGKIWATIAGLTARLQVFEAELPTLEGELLGVQEIITRIRENIQKEKNAYIVSLAFYAQLKQSLELENDRRKHLMLAVAERRAAITVLRNRKADAKEEYKELSKDLTSPGASVLSFNQE